ncbi:MAG: YerC/YecD family TrpR-related protein [Acidaminococcaceae bacterium]|jgi:TrpR-related protein YerC/YecD|nr:YerC/YecD family TrpR-related protein [Acidaminococcaceae bacterium]MCI2110416.1 YerC/YecD family TrpR-related protein [Acidaminococcaceae bacterium]
MSLRSCLNKSDVSQLFKAVLSLKNEDECDAFFEDICTLSEVKDMSQRLEVARLLAAGEKYTTIAKTTGASSTTVSRVNRCLNYGPGGYKKVLKALNKGAEKNERK